MTSNMLTTMGLLPVPALLAADGLIQRMRLRHHYRIECFSPDGELQWVDETENLVVNTGLDEILDKFYKGSTYTALHYLGLTDGTPTVAAADTMASHAGWTEITAYDEANRQTFTPGTVASQSVSNTASKGVFTISAGTTVGGVFLTTNNTKGGSTGILIGAAAFTGGDRSLADNDVLNVTLTASMTSS